MNDKPYLIPAEPAQFEEEIKKSVFITYLTHTPSIEAAKAFVDQIKAKHADARHNCWGFVAGRPEDSMKWGFSDDGEPSGTAGKPILAQLSGSGVQQALKLLQTIEKKITTKLRLTLDYGFMPIAQSIMPQFGAIEVEAEYSDQVVLVVEIELREVSAFTQAIINKSGAKAIVTPLDGQ